jgi:hypothetical protein
MPPELDELGRPINDPNMSPTDFADRPLPGTEDSYLPLEDFGGVPQLSPTGMQMDLGFLDQEFDEENMTDLQKEIWYQTHVEGLLPTPESAGRYARERINQMLARKDPVYQAKLRTMEANALSAEQAAKGEGRSPDGLEYYTNPETGELAARIIPNSPLDNQAKASAKKAAQISATVLREIEEAEALMSSWSTGGKGGLMAKIPLVGQYTPAGRLQDIYNGLRGNIGADGLIDMRKQNVGLGNVSEKQLEIMGQLLGILDAGMPMEYQQSVLNGVRVIYSDVMANASDEDLDMIRKLRHSNRPGGAEAQADATPTDEVEDFGGVMMRRYSDGTWKKE